MSVPLRPALAGGVLLGLAGLVVALAGGCSPGRYHGVLPSDIRPTVRITQAPASTTQPYFYAYEMRWAGFDEDGTIDHFLYCVDPPTRANAETAWVSTTQNRQTFLFHSETVDSATAATGHGYHTFVVKAVDNSGVPSAPESRSFNSFTIAPTVTIVSPVPYHLNTPVFGPAFRISWKGSDPDGRLHTTPVKYKWHVYAEDNLQFDFLTLLVNPDSLRRRYGPTFSDWDSMGGDTTSVNLRGLLPRKRYVFVVIAFDEVGAYSPVLNFDSSMLYFTVDYAGNLGPALTVFNESFYYQFPGGSFSLDPSTYILADLAADQPLNFNWFGTTNTASFIQGYRWKLDGDIGDETPRADEQADIFHWSQWSPGTRGCQLPPIVPPPGIYSQTHFLYVEGRDGEDLTSLAVVKFNVIRPTFDKDLLIVDDTRLAPDKRLTNGTIDKPRGPWPTAAELDTFLFARGGVQWNTYPTGTLSPPGVFNGYTYDTLGTRFQHGGLLTLSDLGHYRKIIWYTDYKGATNTNPPDFSRDPMPELHAVSYPGASNPLATWVKQGGRLWLFGGGIALCLQKEFEKVGSSAAVFSSTDGELVPGRFMYDLPHWQSEITIGSASGCAKPDTPPQAWSGIPDYSKLPDLLSQKYPNTDPMTVYAPTRTSAGDFYQSTFSAEAITKPNTVLEHLDADPRATNLAPALDTLYVASGGIIGQARPIMTYYHGYQNVPLVYSGFPIWFFQRQQVIPLVDFVMQDLWGMPRRPLAR